MIYDPAKNFKDPNQAQINSSLKEKNSSTNPFSNTNSFLKQILEQEKQAKEATQKKEAQGKKAKDPEKDKELDKLSDNENSHMEDLSEVK